MVFPPPPLSRPVDFSEFWSRTIKELDRSLPMVERKAAATRAGIQLEWLSFASLGDARISGYLLRWADGVPGPWSSTATAMGDGARRGGGGRGPRRAHVRS